ncbi:MAG: DUF3488 domain-containing protein [Deltaproteobacteria bacterium]|nr:DUF3488 domain-containing protein [Deltaproteobacteria bacterium]
MSGDRPSAAATGPLWWILRAQWAWGLLPLAFLTEVSRAALAASAAALLAGVHLDRKGAERKLWLRASTPLLFAAMAAAAADFLFGSRDLLFSISVLILGIQAVKFLLPKGVRDGWQLSAISFLEFLASAASTTEIQFAAFAFGYLGLCAGAMWALQAEGERGDGDAAYHIVRPAFAAKILLLAAVGGALFTAILFFVTPRIGLGQVLRSFRRTEGITGFPDTITLRGVTGVKADRRVAARIEFPGSAGAASTAGLYLRGATYSQFDGKTWMRGKRSPQRIQRVGFYYSASPPPPRVRLSEAEIFLEAMENPAIFVYGTPVYFEGNLGDLWMEGDGSYSIGWSAHPALRYRVMYSPETAQSGGMDTETMRKYLELPPGLDDIRELSVRIVAGGRTDAERAELAVRHFGTGFRYTVTDPASSVRDFLFVKNAGFCEHYATALTLILRAAGIPSRIAAGYLGGEWSDPGKYLIVRQSDAHAWTEAWIDGKWVTLDATPPLGEQSPFFARTGTAAIYLDWARQRWDKYVVNYSLKMQAQGVAKGWGVFRRAGTGLSGAFGPMKEFRRHAAAVVAVFLAMAIAAWIVIRRFGGPEGSIARLRGDGTTPLPRPYARLLARLAAAGCRGAPGTTLEEMLRRAVRARPALAGDASRFLSLYHRDRFGAVPLSPDDAREAVRVAVLLARGISRGGAA